MRGTILMLGVAALVGCEESTMVGSGCPNGACPEALVRDDDVCAVRTGVAELAITAGPDEPTLDLHVCLPTPLERGGGGTVQARIFYLITSDAELQVDCTDRAFLKPVSEEFSDSLGDSEDLLCELNQLSVVAGEDGGAPTVAAGEGFYYDDTTGADAHCRDGGPRVVITQGAEPWTGVVVKMATAEQLNADGTADPDLSCEPIQGTEPVGAPCSAQQTEYFDSQVVIATRSDDCGQGVCMAYHLQGRTDVECAEDGPDGSVTGDLECAPPSEIARRMYCTCRCDGPPGATDLCTCPDRFVCVDAVSPEISGVSGSYCVMQYPPGYEPVD
jgi:hypothetical protein